MKRIFDAVAAVLLIAAPVPAFAQADKVAAYVNDFIQRRHIPGVSIAVVKDGKVIHSAGYGESSIELNALADEKTVYEIGSISKQFTAVATLLLVEQP